MISNNLFVELSLGDLASASGSGEDGGTPPREATIQCPAGSTTSTERTHDAGTIIVTIRCSEKK